MKRLPRLVRRSSICIAVAILIAFGCKFSMNYFSQAVSAYLESLIISYSKEVIDQSVGEGVIELLDGKNIIQEAYDTSGKVSYAYLDAKTINHLRNNISRYVADSIEIINKGERFRSVEIPLGYFFGRNYFLSNGIKIPIHLEVIGYQNVEIEKIVESYGLNTTILQVNLIVTLSIRSVIPFQSQIYETKNTVPVALEILNNDIPYYLGSLT